MKLERIPSKIDGYFMVKTPKGYPCNQPYEREHRVIYWIHHGELPPKGHHIHHINHDRLDNRIENLEALSASGHLKKHMDERGAAPISCLNCYQCKKEYTQLERTVKFREKNGQERFFCEKSCQVSYQNQFKKGTHPNYPKNRKPSGKKGINKECLVCKNSFYVRAYRAESAKTCSKPCSYKIKTCKYKDTLLI